LNELNFASMKHRVMSHYEPFRNRAAEHLARVSNPDIPNAYRLFFQESMRSLGPTASMFPSSRYLANALTRPIDFRRARTVVELGPGTGAVTNEILKCMRPDAKLFAIDINPIFIDHLEATCQDPRLIPLRGSAADLLSLLAPHDVQSVDAVVSSLGLTGMDHRSRMFIMRQIGGCLVSHGTMTQYQYAGHFEIAKLRLGGFNEARFLRRFFGEVSVGRVILNLPPALVFTCRK
jgi:phosphatidylethanolamine/phosphatidyl-N-methylethanolamine N-methyltransferase